MIRKYYKTLLFIILTFASARSFAQSDEAAIKAVINRMFEGMRQSDTAMLRSAFSDKAILQTIAKNKEGVTRILTDQVDSFIISISRPHKDIYDERIVFESIKIDNDLAIAWTPYQFYVGDKFSHCGVNSFQLVKLNGEWKIQYLIDTRRRQDCK
ncbi:MAG: nuclear transport factor 2 family protein [Flavisolibacter sp.]